MSRIGLFGGTFDPPHLGHLWIAKKALSEWNLDQIIFIPTSQNPLKKDKAMLSSKERYVAVQNLVKDEKGFSVSDYEIFSASPSFTIDTVKHFLKTFPNDKLFFILGEDAFSQIDKWKDSQNLKKMIEFIVYPREIPISSTQIRENLKKSVL